MNNSTVIAPILTEKASQKTAANIYTFHVGDRVNKYQIKQAVESMFKVKVGKIRIVKKTGKKRRSGKRMQATMTAGRKIAYITLKQGSIDLFPKA